MKLESPNHKSYGHSQYLREMFQDLPKPKGPKPPPPGMTKEEFILSLQSASTRAIMLRPVEQDEAWQNRPMMTKEEHDKLLEQFPPPPERVISPDEFILIEGMRKHSKNTHGQSEDKGFSPEKKEMAVQALIYTPPANVTKEEVQKRAVNLVQYKSEPIEEVWVKMNWFQALIHRLKGNKVKKTIKE